MTWVKSVSYSGEDVFDQDADDITLQNKEWKYNMDKRVKDGFVDGIDAGKEASLQIGFNQGYSEGAAQTRAVGCLKGIVSALQCWCQIQQPGSPGQAAVTDLLQRVTQHEDTLMERMRKALEDPPPSVSDISESMEDLGVDGEGCGGEGCGGEGCREGDCCSRGGDMDVGAPDQPQNPCPSSSDSGESLNQLLQRCMDLVLELGLPQELVQQLQQLMETD